MVHVFGTCLYPGAKLIFYTDHAEKEEIYGDERCSAMLQRVIVAVLVDFGQKWAGIGVP